MTTQRLTFLGLESTAWAVLVIVCCLLAVAAVCWLYRYERRLVSAPIGWSLLGLRILLLVTLLLMALQPTMSWTNQLTEDSSVIVAIDVSESMDLIDDHATEQERKQWAVGLGMIKEQALAREVSAETTTELSEEINTDSETDMNLEFWQSRSRFELARQLLTAPQIGLLERLRKSNNLRLVLFGETVGVPPDLELSGSRETLAKGTAAAATSYHNLLEEIAAQEHCTAAVLITDGVDTSGMQPQAQLKQLGNLSRPVYSILAGSTSQPVDLAIESIDFPDSVYKNDQPFIRVRANTYGYTGQDVEVSLTDIATGQQLTQQVIGAERFVDVEFSLPLETAGRQRFIVDVHPGPNTFNSSVAGEELRLENNQQEFSINVIDDRSQVMLIDGEASWEFRYQDAAYERDERVELFPVLFEQPYLGLLPQTFFDGSIPNSNTSEGPFEEIDLVIWGDADPKNVDQQTWEKLERFVGEQGGTLVVTSGKKHSSAALHHSILSKMLPIDHLRRIDASSRTEMANPNTRGFHLQLTPQGEQHPVMKLETDFDRNRDIWTQLPGHFRGYVGDAKPGAVVLAEPTGGTIATTSTRPAALVAVQNYGLGRVLWLGIDSTWRWRLRRGDQFHYRFWGQMSRWAAEMRSMAGSEDVKLALESSEIEVGQSTTIRARWSRKFLQNLSDDIQAEIEVYPADESQLIPIIRIPLDPVETEPMLHEAKVPELPVGEYRLRLASENLPLGATPIEAQLFINPRRNRETNQLAADRSLLDQFAAATNGAVFLPHQLNDLIDRLSPETRILEEKQDYPLWSHWTLFMMMLVIVSGEWLLRKWHGLP